MTDTAEQDDALLYQVRVTLTSDLRDHVSRPPEQCAEVSRALTDAITPDIRQALAAARDGTDKLRRQVLGYRGMKDAYLRERNAAHEGLAEADRIIELLCDDREAGQAVAKAALTEQRERAETAERKLTEALDQIATERRGRLAAEAAERHVRAVCEQPGPLAVAALRADILAALDAEQPKETP